MIFNGGKLVEFGELGVGAGFQVETTTGFAFGIVVARCSRRVSNNSKRRALNCVDVFTGEMRFVPEHSLVETCDLEGLLKAGEAKKKKPDNSLLDYLLHCKWNGRDGYDFLEYKPGGGSKKPVIIVACGENLSEPKNSDCIISCYYLKDWMDYISSEGGVEDEDLHCLWRLDACERDYVPSTMNTPS